MSSVSETRAREYYNPKGGGGARCWGSAVAKDAERQYWWSWRGIHVDPNAPLTNDELGELKDALVEKNWSWGMGRTRTRRGRRRRRRRRRAVVASRKREKSRRGVWIGGGEWDVMAAPAPPASDLGMETTDLLIEARREKRREETVAGAAVASMLFVLMTTLVLGSWLRSAACTGCTRRALRFCSASRGVYMISQAIAQDMRSKDGLGGEKNWILTYGVTSSSTRSFLSFLFRPSSSVRVRHRPSLSATSGRSRTSRSWGRSRGRSRWDRDLCARGVESRAPVRVRQRDTLRQHHGRDGPGDGAVCSPI